MKTVVIKVQELHRGPDHRVESVTTREVTLLPEPDDALVMLRPEDMVFSAAERLAQVAGPDVPITEEGD